MQRAITLSHHKTKREFIISSKTKPQKLKALAKKALNLHTEIKCLRNSEGRWRIEEVLGPGGPTANDFEVVLQDESEEDRSKSEVCSQKNMSKVSGRKNPPSENELLDSKFYIDDFQLFMSEVSSKQSNGLFGIVFFSNRKKASFLGKKILRELIFEFDKIEFFYALHPIKMHTSSALLGDILVFSLFRGKRMIHEREFPEQITAADEILNYIKNLIKIGDINFDLPFTEPKKPKNLIHVHQQRSFDHKIETSPEKLSDFGGKPNRTTELIKIKAVTPDKDLKSRKGFTNPKQESPIKSHVTNEISFENDFFQPEWFFEGDALSRLEKGLLSALIKVNDSTLLTFLHGLNLKSTTHQQLHVKLVKVFLREVLEDKLLEFTAEEKQMVEENQDNRKSFVFTALLKLYKFGNLRDFVTSLSRGFDALRLADKQRQEQAEKQEPYEASPAEEELPQEIKLEHRDSQIQYSSIARNNTEKNKGGFTIKLLDCENEQENSFSESVSPFRQNSKVRLEHIDIASHFHSKALWHVPAHILKDIEFGTEYSEADRAGISDLILKNDAFMMQAFIRNPERGKKGEKISSKTVKKYLRQIESRYDKIRERTVTEPGLQLKMQKLEIFHGLIYYLYKQRIINKKQLKIAFYLYTWSDLNILAAFEVYLLDRNLEELVDTIYSIDYNYYQNNLYEVDHAEVVQFDLTIESQLIILFLYENHIQSEKFIRAGDSSLLQLYTNLAISQEELIHKIVEMSKAKKEALKNLAKVENFNESREQEKKKDRCQFVEQIMNTRYKHSGKTDLVKYCLEHDEPVITAMFDKLESQNNQQEWIEAFGSYLSTIDDTHMRLVVQELAGEAGLSLSRIGEIRGDVLRGIYEVYLQTNDKADTIDSLERALRKASRNASPRQTA